MTAESITTMVVKLIIESACEDRKRNLEFLREFESALRTDPKTVFHTVKRYCQYPANCTAAYSRLWMHGYDPLPFIFEKVDPKQGCLICGEKLKKDLVRITAVSAKRKVKQITVHSQCYEEMTFGLALYGAIRRIADVSKKEGLI